MFSCQVTKVDGALAGVTFPDAEETLEWIYRGSMRFEPLAKSMGVKFERGVVRKEKTAFCNGNTFLFYFSVLQKSLHAVI